HAPGAAALQGRWMEAKHELHRRAGWKLLAARIARGLAGDVDPDATLARIERELPAAPYRAKEGMNQCLVWIGLHVPGYTDAAIAVGERLGRWDPRPVPKGCTSSYAPEWIAAVLALKRGEKTEARKAMEASRSRAAKKPTQPKVATAKKAPARKNAPAAKKRTAASLARSKARRAR
ncbi:MAG: DNA alkylation repair protein, partial [Myxococcales bacterium]